MKKITVTITDEALNAFAEAQNYNEFIQDRETGRIMPNTQTKEDFLAASLFKNLSDLAVNFMVNKQLQAHAKVVSEAIVAEFSEAINVSIENV